MTKLIPATYENGHLELRQPLNLPNHQKVLIAVTIPSDDVPSLYINKLAEHSPSYGFLNSPQEDIYTLEDGQQIDE